MSTLDGHGTRVFVDEVPGSYFEVSGLTAQAGKALESAVQRLVPSGWEAAWEPLFDSLEVRPKNYATKVFAEAEFTDWNKSRNHDKIKAFVESWLTPKTASGGHTMNRKIASQDADRLLTRLDRLAATVQAKYASWGMPFEAAKEIVNAIDKTADEVEVTAFGRQSLARRQEEVMGGKTARVIQRDADEKYMDTFKNPMQPRQVEADEPYMKIYEDDQSVAVGTGESTTGRKLAPYYK